MKLNQIVDLIKGQIHTCTDKWILSSSLLVVLI